MSDLDTATTSESAEDVVDVVVDPVEDIADRLRTAIERARTAVHQVVEPTCPSTTFLAALASELEAASVAPGAVAHPELLDADRYWEASLKPQGKTVRDHTGVIVGHLEEDVTALIDALELALGDQVDQVAAADAVAEEPHGLRRMAIDAIAEHCRRLHHDLAAILTLLPPDDVIRGSREHYDEALRAKATADVEALRGPYLREAGGNAEHQAAAERTWGETFAQRVNHRETMLRNELPWRHQDLAIVAHERARMRVEQLLDDTVTGLQAPLEDLGERLVRRYDDAIGVAR